MGGVVKKMSISNHQDALQKLIREIDHIRASLKWTYEQQCHLINAAQEIEEILEGK